VGTTATEGHVFIGVTRDIHLVGVQEDVLVAVARGKPGDHLLALLDHGTVEVHVLGRGATEVVDGACVTQELFNSPGDELRVLLQESELVRVMMLFRCSDGVTRGLLPATKQEVGVITV
jgi:hypothetical protein